MKTKIFTTLFLINCMFFAAFAGTVTQQDAQNVALNFFKTTAGSTTPHGGFTATLAYTGTATDGIVTYYVFNITPGKGFVIISASDNDGPVIGYSTESNFVTGFGKTGLTETLGRWSEEIHTVIKNNLVATPKAAGLWSAYRQGVNPGTAKSSGVGPLCRTTWDQSSETGGTPALYNGDCPYDVNAEAHAVTGCVATAMAQIMKFWNFPARGTGTASYDDATADGYQENYGVQTFNFNTRPFNWASMPDSLTNNSSLLQDSSIAVLMYACGVSVYMDYSPNGSGAWVVDSESTNGASSQQAYALYFKYNPNSISAADYNSYSTQAWISLIENEFNQGRPVQYQGYDVDAGGHTWVCDGYNSSDMLHMNWGWGGQDNGWYAVTNLDPSYDFTYNIYALIGIEPGIYAVAANTTICSGDTTTLSVTGAPAVATYSWSPSTGLSCTTCVSPKAFPTTTTTYSVSVDSGGVTTTSAVTVQVTTPGVLNYSLSASAVCAGISSVLSLQAVSGTITITPQASVVWLDSVTARLSPDTTTTYQIISQSSVCGVPDTGSVTVQVTQHSPITVTTTATTVCEDDYVEVTYTGLTNASIYGDGYYYSTGTTGFEIEPYATGNFILTGTNSCGNIYTDTIHLTVVNSYSLAYTLSKSTICQGDTAVLTITGSTTIQINPANMVVSVGNGVYYLIPDTNTTFTISGYNSVCNTYGDLDLTIKVIKTGSIDYNLTASSTCAGYEDELYLYGVRPLITTIPTLNVYFSDSTDAYAYFYPDSSTTYMVSAPTVCGTYDTAFVHVKVLPLASATVKSNSICAGDSTLLTIVGLTSAVISPSTGFTKIDSAHYELHPATTTEYEIYGYNCDNYYSYYYVTVSVIGPGIVNYTIGDTDICSGNDAYLQLHGIKNVQITPTSYLYMTDSTDFYTYLYPTATTTYTVSGASVCGSTVSQNITVHVAPYPTYTLQTTHICAGGSTNLSVKGLFNATVTPSATAVWVNDSVVKLSPMVTTEYELYGTECSGYSEYYYVTVTVLPAGGLTYTINDTSICSGSDAYLTVSGASNITISPTTYLDNTDSFDVYGYLYPTATTQYIISGNSVCTHTVVKDTFNIHVLSSTGSYTLSRQAVCNNDSTLLELTGIEDFEISPTLNTSYLNYNSIYLFPTTTTTYTISGYSTCNEEYVDLPVTVTVGAPAIVTEAFDSVICPYDSTEICASAGFVNYTWSTGQTGLCIAATLPGYYYVVGTDVNNCSAQSSPLHIQLLSGPSLNITARHDTLFASAGTNYQWMLDGTPIPGATDPFFVPTTIGNYTVQLGAANGCTEVSQQYLFTGLGVNTVAGNDNIQVYPNPSSDKWFIEMGDGWNGSQCEIYDATGRLVYSAPIESSKYQVAAGLASGVYLLKIVSGEKVVYANKVVKL